MLNKHSEVGFHTMHLVVAATQMEMDAFKRIAYTDDARSELLVSGVGPMESGVTLSRYLERHHTKIETVVNFGIGGAYFSSSDKQLDVLDLCLAKREVLGDFGICYDERVEPFGQEVIPAPYLFELDSTLLHEARSALDEGSLSADIGTFVTVNGASGRKVRGDFFAARYQALCENMEGAAVARVCELFTKPLLEIRAISNLVEDRPGQKWLIAEAAARAAQAAALIIKRFRDIS